MHRRAFIGTTGAVVLAGCGVLGGDSEGPVSADLDAEDEASFISDSFEMSEGDEYEVTIEAGDEQQAQVGIVPEEEEGIGPGDDVGWGWWVDAGETETDTIEVDETDTYVWWITQGTASVEGEEV